MEELPVSVERIRIMTPGNLKALVDVRLGPLLVRNCRIIQQPEQRPYLSLPQERREDGRYFPIVTTQDRELKDRIQSAVLAAFNGVGRGCHDEECNSPS
jgi:DNA-binding cell septation regulator SpoVG